MAQMRTHFRERLEERYPGKGNDLEKILYNTVLRQQQSSGKLGFDFHLFRTAYKRKGKSMLENLSNEDSNLKKQLDADLAQFVSLVALPSKEWERELWQLHVDAIPRENETMREGKFDCRRCFSRGMYSRNTSDRESQTRSADEPMTIFVVCHTCNYTYKFSS